MMKTRFWIAVGILAVLMVGGGVIMQAQDNPDPRFVGQVAAPEFPEGLDWLNVSAPLTMDGLRGRIVILDFWTYGCINCIHMIPTLAQLEAKYAAEIVVIGVHSAKFKGEGKTDNIRQIVQRYDIHHPVINDFEFKVWRTYGVPAWPTFAIVDPRGSVVAMQSGEISFEAFDGYLGDMIAYYDNLGENDLTRQPLELALEGAGDPGTPLLFPGKVRVDTEGNRLFIADTNHHRIVVANLTTYEVQTVIGAGRRGFDDGDFATATFNKPQGMELRGSILYVADTNNHALRAIDLDAKTVTTIAGTGTKGAGIVPFTTLVSDPLTFDLRSPWDVRMGAGDILYIAMAGSHQLWQMNLADNTLQAAVGNAREAQKNSTLADSELAQPSGLYYEDGDLYFADSESSTIRVARINADLVEVISGTTANDLFDFDDIDGAYGVNRLQHALGVTGDGTGNVYIADTYNSKIKLFDAETRATETAFGLGGEGGYRDGAAAVAEFDEPGGLDYADGKVYVADTNNHAIRVIDLAAGEVSTVVFPNPEALKIDTNTVTVIGGNMAAGATLTVDPQTLGVGEAELVLNFKLPEGFKLNTLATSTVEVVGLNSFFTFEDEFFEVTGSSVTLPLTVAEGEGSLVLAVTLFYCEATNEEFCLVDDVQIDIPVTIAADATSHTLAVERIVIPPEAYQ